MVLVSLRSVHEIMRAICQVLWLFNCWTFQVSFVVSDLPDLREHLIWILEGLGGRAGCHMYWALGSRRSLFGWFVLCSVGAYEQLPFASQSVRLELVGHGANMSQTQCD